METLLKTEKIYSLKNLIVYDKIDDILKGKIKEKGLNYYDY